MLISRYSDFAIQTVKVRTVSNQNFSHLQSVIQNRLTLFLNELLVLADRM